jgi:hypothetical protein
MGGNAFPTAMSESAFPFVEIASSRARAHLPLSLAGDKFVLLLVCVTGKARGDVVITQRRSDGVVSAGYGIRIA